MQTVRFDATAGGMIVQIHCAVPSDQDWSDMLRFMEERRDRLVGGLAISLGDFGPTSAQREQLRGLLNQMPKNFRFALLADSRITRGILTAINWLSKNQVESRAFSRSEINAALAYLNLTEENKKATLELVERLTPQATELHNKIAG